MAEGRLISFWSDGPGAGRRTLARELALYWTDQSLDVLLIQVGDTPPHQNPADWVPRFRSLSPIMLRNFLVGPREAYGNIVFQELPESALLKELLKMVVPAYAWTIVIGPRELTPEVRPLLEASDLLIWVGRA